MFKRKIMFMTYSIKKYYQFTHLRNWKKIINAKYVRLPWEAYVLKIINFAIDIKTSNQYIVIFLL